MLVYVFCVCVNVHVYMYVCIYVCVCMCVYLFVLVCDRPKRQWSGWGQRRAATHLRQAVVGPNNLPNWGAELRYVLGSQTSATTNLNLNL